MMTCPKCNSDKLIKYGFHVVDDSQYQQYKCKDCSHRFVPNKPKAEFRKSVYNEETLRYIKANYKTIALNIRKDTFGDLIERLEHFEQTHPEKGMLKKKIQEILDEHFPKMEQGRPRNRTAIK